MPSISTAPHKSLETQAESPVLGLSRWPELWVPLGRGKPSWGSGAVMV